MSTTPIDDDTLFRRNKFADALNQHGFPTSPATLATMASRGGGPPFELWGRIPLYRWGPGLAWAKSRLSKPHANTSQADARAGPTPDAPPLRDGSPRIAPSTGPVPRQPAAAAPAATASRSAARGRRKSDMA
jgi:hypothetical protein